MFLLCGFLVAFGWICARFWEAAIERRAQQRAWDNIHAAHQRAVDRNADAVRRQLSEDQAMRSAARLQRSSSKVTISSLIGSRQTTDASIREASPSVLS